MEKALSVFLNRDLAGTLIATITGCRFGTTTLASSPHFFRYQSRCRISRA